MIIYSLGNYNNIKINVTFRSFRSYLSTEWTRGLTETATKNVTEKSLRRMRDPNADRCEGGPVGIKSALNFMHYIWFVSRKLGLRFCVP